MTSLHSDLGTRAGAILLLAALLLQGQSAAAADTGECGTLVAERSRLQSEKAVIGETISVAALGARAKSAKPPKAGDVGQMVGGAAASALLPFGVGALLNAGVTLARRSARKSAAAKVTGPDIPALLAREIEIDERLAAIQTSSCGGVQGLKIASP